MSAGSAQRSRPRVAVREYAVLCVAALTLGYTAWGFGGIPTWSLHVLLYGGLATLFMALVPMPKSWNGADGEHGNWTSWKRLLRFPAFWLGGLFLLYITIQTWNAELVQVRQGTVWWMIRQKPNVPWLPTGVEAEYAMMNGWRVLVKYAAAFSLVCGVWVGLRRRQSVVALIWVFAGCATAMALLGILQSITDAEGLYWRVRSGNQNFWGTFFYRNQAAGFLNLGIAACVFLFFYHARRTEVEGRQTGPHLLAYCFSWFIFASVAMSVSRGGTIFGGLLLGVFHVLLIVRFFVSRGWRSNILISVIVSAVLLGGAWTATRMIDWDALDERFGQIVLDDVTTEERYRSTMVTLEMAQDRLTFGWGAGSFRYVFPIYQQKYPEMFHSQYNRRAGEWRGRRMYRYAHNDIVQSLAEYGIVGCAILVATLMFWIGLLLACGRGFRLASCGVAGVMLAGGGHGFIEFIFQSPSYMVAFCALIAGGSQLIFLEWGRRRKRERTGAG